MKYWKCKQCIHSTTHKRKGDIKTPLQDGVVCYREDKEQKIKDDDNECNFYCTDAK